MGLGGTWQACRPRPLLMLPPVRLARTEPCTGLWVQQGPPGRSAHGGPSQPQPSPAARAPPFPQPRPDPGNLPTPPPHFKENPACGSPAEPAKPGSRGAEAHEERACLEMFSAEKHSECAGRASLGVFGFWLRRRARPFWRNRLAEGEKGAT